MWAFLQLTSLLDFDCLRKPQDMFNLLNVPVSQLLRNKSKTTTCLNQSIREVLTLNNVATRKQLALKSG